MKINILISTNTRLNGTRLVFISLILVLFSVLLWAQSAQAASLTINPASGTFSVGSTFDIAVFLDTQGTSINTIQASLSFPPDKLQLVPRTAERSIITVYTSPPQFDNQKGLIDLQGGIPGGINVSNGRVIVWTFRVKSVGAALVRFSDASKVLANDGLGTDVLQNVQNAVYELVLPPPGGPIVVSQTHPDQAKWYSNSTALLTWAGDEPGVEGYSHILNNIPIDIPDDISEGLRTTVTYKNLGDGTQYFHIKSQRRGSWGGVTHFALNIDTFPPAKFPIEVTPSARTTRRQPVIQFATSDSFSGLDHYELKIVPLNLGRAQAFAPIGQPLFMEVVSPYVSPELSLGTYDFIVRAYDKAGNFQEVAKRVKVVTALFKFITGKGVELKGQFVVPWLWFWIVAGFILGLLIYLAWRLKRWHDQVHQRRLRKEPPSHINEQLEELKKYRARYGKIAMLLLIFAATVLIHAPALAQRVEQSPPLISTVSKDISNEEIFYVGGKTDAANIEVIIYLQNLQSGETLSQTVTSDKNGDWFYRHNTFLTSGNYLLWAQSKIGEQVSPPTPQVQMTVKPTAIQFGASRISTEFLYLISVIVLFLIVAGLLGYIIFHGVQGRKKHRLFLAEVKEAEESVRRGFAIIRRDVEAELAVVRKAKLKGSLSEEERIKEEQLLKDLASVEQYVGKEIWDIEETEHAG